MCADHADINFLLLRQGRHFMFHIVGEGGVAEQLCPLTLYHVTVRPCSLTCGGGAGLVQMCVF